MPSRVEVLTAHGDDAERWRAVLAALPPDRQDVHYFPEYAALYEEKGVEARAVLLRADCGCVLYPFLLRPVDIGGAQPLVGGRPARDLAMPYGIGGPVCTAPEADQATLYQRFDAAFVDWCRQERLASEFLCPHMFTGSLELVLQNPAYHCEAVKPVVVVDLAGGLPELRSQLRKGHKADIGRARKSGVRVDRVDPDPALYAACNRLYYATMDRHRAARRWYFEEHYFRSCMERLGPRGCAFFLARAADGGMAAWSVVIVHGPTAYYHFAASDPAYAAAKPSTLMVHEVCLWAQERGCRRLYMGGGATLAPDDGIYRFKSGFSKHTVMLYTACRVLDGETYDALGRIKERHERQVAQIPANPDFFPLYRR